MFRDFRYTFRRTFRFIGLSLLTAASTAATISMTIGCTRPQIANEGSHSTQTERQQRFEEIFDELDTNHDGYLSREEAEVGVHRLSHHDLSESTNAQLKLGARHSQTAREAHLAKFKKLSRQEQDELIARAFAQAGAKSAARDRERISKDDFRKIVIGPEIENQEGDKDRSSLEPNPWEKVL